MLLIVDPIRLQLGQTMDQGLFTVGKCAVQPSPKRNYQQHLCQDGNQNRHWDSVLQRDSSDPIMRELKKALLFKVLCVIQEKGVTSQTATISIYEKSVGFRGICGINLDLPGSWIYECVPAFTPQISQFCSKTL